MGKRNEEHSFSIEMTSKEFMRNISFQYREKGHIFFEGFLGKLKNVTLVEGVMLEIEGVNGVLKLDITQQEIKNVLLSRETKINGGETN